MPISIKNRAIMSKTQETSELKHIFMQLGFSLNGTVDRSPAVPGNEVDTF